MQSLAGLMHFRRDTTGLQQGAQFSYPVNLDDPSFTARSFLGAGVPFAPLQSNLNMRGGFTYSRTPGLINDLVNMSSQYGMMGGLTLASNISERLDFLMDVGLEYLTLSRPAATLSGGESQRIRLASQIGSGLTGVLYVLDEPSIGLHQRDNARLLQTLERLRDLGNTVIVVEHDEEFIRDSDYLVDMGPGAGTHGGNVVARGTPQEVMQKPESLTAQYLTGFRQIPLPDKRRPGRKGQAITVKGARAHNLQDVTAKIPLGTFTCVTGVSGGGKSTLTIETLFKASSRKLMNAKTVPGRHERIEGLDCDVAILDRNFRY